MPAFDVVKMIKFRTWNQNQHVCRVSPHIPPCIMYADTHTRGFARDLSRVISGDRLLRDASCIVITSTLSNSIHHSLIIASLWHSHDTQPYRKNIITECWMVQPFSLMLDMRQRFHHLDLTYINDIWRLKSRHFKLIDLQKKTYVAPFVLGVNFFNTFDRE